MKITNFNFKVRLNLKTENSNVKLADDKIVPKSLFTIHITPTGLGKHGNS